MGSLTSCLKKAGDALPADTKAAILNRARELRGEGVPTAEAARQAVLDVMQQNKAALDEVSGAMSEGRQLFEPPKDEPQAAKSAEQAQKAEVSEMQARVNDAAARFPDLQVQLDGMDAPMPLADFMAAVQKEADEMKADAPDIMDAATCALLNSAL